jgi:hypothetical protein
MTQPQHAERQPQDESQVAIECARFLSMLSAQSAATQPCKQAEEEYPNKAAVSWLLNDGDAPPAPSFPCARAVKAEPPAAHSWAVKDRAPSPAASSTSEQDVTKALAKFSQVAVERARAAASPAPSAGSASHSRADTESPRRGKRPAEPLSLAAVAATRAANARAEARGSGGSGGSSEEEDGDRKQWTIALDAALAAKIYAARPWNAGTRYGSMAEATRIGELHGVSPKTIRDIWNRKSWVKATRPFWTPAEEAAFVPRRHRRSGGAPPSGVEPKAKKARA